LTYTVLAGLCGGIIYLFTLDVDKASAPVKVLVGLLRSHFRPSIALLAIAALLLGCTWLYASRREDFEKLGRCEHVRLLVSSAKLEYNHLDIVNPNPYYVEHPEGQQARKYLVSRARLLILGRPLGGKTRLAFQLARAAKKTWVLRLEPEFTKWDSLNFPTVPFQCRVLCIFDDADKFLGKLNLGRVERVLGEQCQLQMIVTCRLGPELEQVRSSREMAAFLDSLPQVECSDFDESELLTLARQVGRPEDATWYDRTPGSVLLGLREMSNRLKAAPGDAQAVMRAMFLLRTAFVYAPGKKLVAAVVKEVYEQNLMEGSFDEAVRALVRDGFLQDNQELRPRHDAYLTRSFLPYYPEDSTRLDDDLERIGPIVEKAGTARDVQSLGTLWKTRRNFERAISFLQNAATRITDDEVLYFDLGFCLQSRNRVDEAIASYRKALEISPNDAGTLNNLGVALKAKGLLDEAIASYRKALEISPNDADTLNNLGNALKAKGLLDEAIASYRKALEISPNHADTLYNLGIALKAKGSGVESP